MEINYHWKLEDIYITDHHWINAFSKVKETTASLVKYKGSLGTSAKVLLTFLNEQSNNTKEFYRVHSYAGMKSDQDTRESMYLAKLQELSQADADLLLCRQMQYHLLQRTRFFLF